MGVNTKKEKIQASAGRPQANVPHGTETIRRFAPSAAALGAFCAQQILDDLRKELEDVDLRGAKTNHHPARASR